jgi:hypothetical protein
MKRSIVDTAIFASCMLAPIAPSDYSKQIVTIAFGALFLRIVTSSNVQKFIVQKVFILTLFLPGISSAFTTAPEHLIRFVPILLLLLGFPHKGYDLRSRTLASIVAGAIAYLFISQIFIALGNPVALEFRNSWYPIENNVWNYGYVDSIFFDRTTFRAAGVFYNPNVLALILTLYYFIFAINYDNIPQISGQKKSKKYNTRKYIYSAVTSVSFLSIFFTGTRTAIIATLSFIVLSKFDFKSLEKLRIKLSSLLIVSGSIVFVFYYVWERLVEGIVSEEGSANVKFAILKYYLGDTNTISLLFGGTFDLQFDAEIGNWIGSSGFIGFAGFIIVLSIFFRYIANTRIIIFSFFLISIGNTLFYGLLTATLAVVSTMITTVYWWESLKDNSKLSDDMLSDSEYYVINSLR